MSQYRILKKFRPMGFTGSIEFGDYKNNTAGPNWPVCQPQAGEFCRKIK